MKKVFLCGEGTHDIGGWASSASWRADDHGRVEPGVAEALMAAHGREGWEIVGGEPWKNLRGRFAAGSARRGRHRDTQNVLIGALRAEELGADLLVLMRDSDGDPERAKAVRRHSR